MNITPTIESIHLVEEISKTAKTFHHHFHILYDIASLFDGKINYVEIGCYKGASACLMTKRPKTNVISIDTGTPIKPGEAWKNILRYNTWGNRFEYIQGNSHDATTRNKLRSCMLGGIDILFIDGGHSFGDVITDFEMYSSLVNAGGFIVFDDYLDKEFSPEVRQAVDSIVEGLIGHEIIGTIKNSIGAYPADVLDNNCFILRKL